MKKYVIFTAFLTALSLVTLTAGHIWVNSARDKVEIGETVLEGDPAFAAGLTVSMHLCDRESHLFWDTAFTPGNTEETETDFRFSTGGDKEPYIGRDSVQLECASSQFGISGLISEEFDFNWLTRPVLDIASRMPDDGERTETVRLADYYEYYPMDLQARSGEGNFWGGSNTVMQQNWLNRYFRLRVNEQDMVEVTVRKTNGEIYGADMGPAEGYSSNYFYSEGVITPGGVCVIAESYDSDGHPDGRLQCPDGPGVHFIPADVETEAYWDYYDLSKIRLLYPTGDAEALRLTATEDKARLLLYTREADTLVLTVLDTESGDALQRMELMEMEEEDYSVFLLEQDSLHLVRLEAGAFCLLEEQDGTFRQVLTGSISPAAADYILSSGSADGAALAWDGSRMAFAAATPYCSSYYGDDVRAGVWDADGLRFLGGYSNGISRDPVTQKNAAAYRSMQTPLEIAFTDSRQSG